MLHAVYCLWAYVSIITVPVNTLFVNNLLWFDVLHAEIDGGLNLLCKGFLLRCKCCLRDFSSQSMVHCVSLAPCALQIYDVICDSNRSTRAPSTSKLFVHIRSQTLGGKYLVFFWSFFLGWQILLYVTVLSRIIHSLQLIASYKT